MATQSEIYSEIESLIPADMWIRYSHLSFGEMAEISELSDYADDLRDAETAWFAADDA